MDITWLLKVCIQCTSTGVFRSDNKHHTLHTHVIQKKKEKSVYVML